MTTKHSDDSDHIADAIREFWFHTSRPEDWFVKSADFDATIRTRFGDLVIAAQRGDLDHWHQHQHLCLAYILICDQFPRNIFRDDARAFASDARAREATNHALRSGWDHADDQPTRLFYYLPLMHSEVLADVEKSVLLCEPLGPLSHQAAIAHRDIVKRFGRYPHRNKALDRPSSAQEIAFLRQPDSSF